METILTDKELKTKKYPIDTLIHNVNNLSIKTLLHWQILNSDFCKKYILDESYQNVEEYYLITIEYVLKKQPHLKYEDLVN